MFLLKYGPQASEAQEGVAFYGRAGQAVIKSLERLNVDPLAVYGTNCLKFAGQRVAQARAMLVRELHIVQPKLLVADGRGHASLPERARVSALRPGGGGGSESCNGSRRRSTRCSFPTSTHPLTSRHKKTEFWNAFKALGPWWAELPPY